MKWSGAKWNKSWFSIEKLLTVSVKLLLTNNNLGRNTLHGIEMKFTVTTLLEKGYSQRQISKELNISRRTVKKHFNEIRSGSINLDNAIGLK